MTEMKMEIAPIINRIADEKELLKSSLPANIINVPTNPVEAKIEININNGFLNLGKISTCSTDL